MPKRKQPEQRKRQLGNVIETGLYRGSFAVSTPELRQIQPSRRKIISRWFDPKKKMYMYRLFNWRGKEGTKRSRGKSGRGL